MSTQTLSPPAQILAPSPSRPVTPPDADWMPVAFPKGVWKRWLRRRQECGGDRHDEVWDGVYVVIPLGNIDHQELATLLSSACLAGLVGIPGTRVFAGTNVSDDRDDWTKNYRCPDVAIYLPGNPAEARETHWGGGPDFAVEVVSRGDRSRDKFGFYAQVGVKELLFVERQPWALELYRRDGATWTLAGRSEPATSDILESTVLPLSFRLLPAEPRPRIEILGRDGRGPWIA